MNLGYKITFKYDHIHKWEFNVEKLRDAEYIIDTMIKYLAYPEFKDVDVLIEPFIIELPEEETNE